MQIMKSGELIKHTGKAEHGFFNNNNKKRVGGPKIRVGRVTRTTHSFCFGLEVECFQSLIDF